MVIGTVGGAAVAPAVAEEVGEIVRRERALDDELLRLLQARRDDTLEAPAAVAARRRSLQSYRGTPPPDPLLIERLG